MREDIDVHQITTLDDLCFNVVRYIIDVNPETCDIEFSNYYSTLWEYKPSYDVVDIDEKVLLLQNIIMLLRPNESFSILLNDDVNGHLMCIGEIIITIDNHNMIQVDYTNNMLNCSFTVIHFLGVTN